MRIAIILPLVLAACSTGAPVPSSESNVAFESGSKPMPVPTASPAGTGEPASPVATGTPVPAEPSATPSPQPSDVAVLEDEPEQSPDAAVQLIRRYYRLVGRGDYAAAYALWDDGGRAPGGNPAAFAREFAKYSRYDAAVGRPGRIDAGAGQRYVEVPVALTGTLASGEAFAAQGTVTLHRTGAIDGATLRQRSWRIDKIETRPRAVESTSTFSPVPSGTVAARVKRYRCGDGSLMLVRFGSDDTADVEVGGSLLGKLAGQRPGSEIWYKRGNVELRGKGEEATLARPGGPDLHCLVQS